MIKQNVLRDGTMGRYKIVKCHQSEPTKERVSIGTGKAQTLKQFENVIRWTFELVLDKSSVKISDYASMSDGNAMDPNDASQRCYDPALDVTVRFYMWAHRRTIDGKLGPFVAGTVRLGDEKGNKWLSKADADRLQTLAGRPVGTKRSDGQSHPMEWPAMVWVAVTQRGQYNNPTEFGDESLSKRAQAMAQVMDEVQEDASANASMDDVGDAGDSEIKAEATEPAKPAKSKKARK